MTGRSTSQRKRPRDENGRFITKKTVTAVKKHRRDLDQSTTGFRWINGRRQKLIG